MPTDLENRILQALRLYFARQGHAPTLVELGQQVGVNSKGTIHRYINSLIEQGYLEKGEKGWRSIQLTPQASEGLYSLPLLGRIAAGAPIEAIPDQNEFNLLDRWMGADRYVLQVKGDSMIEAGILDGDWVIIHKSNQARAGEIVVALINNEESTLKTLAYTSTGEIKLIPANSDMPPMIYPAEQVAIQGVLVGQMRHYPRA